MREEIRARGQAILPVLRMDGRGERAMMILVVVILGRAQPARLRVIPSQLRAQTRCTTRLQHRRHWSASYLSRRWSWEERTGMRVLGRCESTQWRSRCDWTLDRQDCRVLLLMTLCSGINTVTGMVVSTEDVDSVASVARSAARQRGIVISYDGLGMGLAHLQFTGWSLCNSLLSYNYKDSVYYFLWIFILKLKPCRETSLFLVRADTTNAICSAVFSRVSVGQ